MTGATGALLQVQRALVMRFQDFIDGPSGLDATLARYRLSAPDIPHQLYDEVPAGLPSFYRIGSADIEYLSGQVTPVWSIDQDIEAHIDPVRGRALVLAMADVIENAFPPSSGYDAWFSDISWMDSAGVPVLADVRFVDMTPRTATIGYSTGGLTYQAVISYDLVVEGTSS